MIGRIKRGTRIAASYANVFAELLALEARQEVQRAADRYRQKAIAIVLLLFAFVWLNVGAFVLIWDSPYRHWMPFAIGGGTALIGLLIWVSSRAAGREPPFAAARQALAEDAALWNIDLRPGHVLTEPQASAGAQARAGTGDARDAAPPGAAAMSPEPPPPEPPPPSVEDLARQLRALRVALKLTVSGLPRPEATGAASFASGAAKPEGAAGAQASGAARDAASQGFHPKSRTMRTLMSLVGEGGADGGSPGAWPVRVAALLVAGRFLQRHGRWLIAAWPVVRLVVGQMARSRRAERRAAAAAATAAAAADVGARMQDPTDQDGPMRTSTARSADAPVSFPGSTTAPGARPPPR